MMLYMHVLFLKDCITKVDSYIYKYKRKTWKGKMIKNVLKRRGECGTYLATARRLPLQLMNESSVFILFHRDLSAPAMSTDMGQVSVALSPSF